MLLIHGGGWKNGDKSDYLEAWTFGPYLDVGISVAAINYRFIDRGHGAKRRAAGEGLLVRCGRGRCKRFAQERSSGILILCVSARWVSLPGRARLCGWLFTYDLANPSSSDHVAQRINSLAMRCIECSLSSSLYPKEK